MTDNQRLTATRMYVTERKSDLYIAYTLGLTLEAVRALTSLLVREPTPHSRTIRSRPLTVRLMEGGRCGGNRCRLN